MRKKEISMIILAGGASSRMGRDKSDLTIDGKTFLEMQIEKGEKLGISDILLSGYHGENKYKYPIIPDRFPKDVKALIRTGDEYGYGMELLKAVERVNERQKTVLFDKIQKHYEGNVKGKHFGLWGLSFKPATDDMREAPSLVLIGQLLEAGATVKAFDPVAMEEAKRRLGDRIGYAANMYDALTDADAMIIVTEWQEFKVPKFTFIEKALKEKVIFDGRNIYNPEQMREFGYTYYGIGKNR